MLLLERMYNPSIPPVVCHFSMPMAPFTVYDVLPPFVGPHLAVLPRICPLTP